MLRSTLEAGTITPTPLSGTYIAALDGVRGVAILLVLAFHLGRDSSRFLELHHPILKATTFGWCGVDLFFVLSGFLITGILYDSRSSENYFRSFYARRILRIFPLYYGALLVVAILAAIVPELTWGSHSLLWQALFLTNFLVMAYGWNAVGDGMAHFWSLAVEEHFYLAWPFLVRLGTRRQLMLAAAAIAVAGLALRSALLASGVSTVDVYVSTPTRIDALAIGALCALAVRGPGGAARVAQPAAITMLFCGVGVLLVIFGRWTLSLQDPLMLTAGLTLLALTFGGAIVTSLTWRPLRLALSNSTLCWFGRYSFGLYVWHLIIIYFLFQPFVREKFLGSDPQTAAVLLYMLFTVALILAVSVLSYHCWEMPFLNLKRYFPRNSGANGQPPSTGGDVRSQSAGAGLDAKGQAPQNVDRPARGAWE